MSKPSYAAVVAAPPPADSSSKPPQGDAPPPYTVQGGPSQGPSNPGHPSHSQVESQPITSGGWTPPPSMAVAKSRALRRFWVAFLWAWGIWILIGLIIGGGVSDIETNPVGRHGHWGKHGQWHDDVKIITIYSGEEIAEQTIGFETFQ